MGFARVCVWLCLGLSSLSLVAGEGKDEESRALELGFGGFAQRFSEGSDPWRGWLLDVSLGKPGSQWQLSAAGYKRPEGTGTFIILSKDFSFGDAHWLSLGAGGGTGADYLARWRLETELHLEASSGLGLGLLGALARFTDGLEIQTLQAGPSWSRGSWFLSARYQRLDYRPDGGYDQGYLLDIRKSLGDRGAWRSLRLGYGHGIIESLQGSAGIAGPTGSWGGASYGGIGPGGWNRGPGGSQGNGPGGSQWNGTGGPGSGPGPGGISFLRQTSEAEDLAVSGPLPTERMLALLSNWPLTAKVSLRTEVSWGEREGLYHTLGGSLQIVMQFRTPNKTPNLWRTSR